MMIPALPPPPIIVNPAGMTMNIITIDTDGTLGIAHIFRTIIPRIGHPSLLVSPMAIPGMIHGITAAIGIMIRGFVAPHTSVTVGPSIIRQFMLISLTPFLTIDIGHPMPGGMVQTSGRIVILAARAAGAGEHLEAAAVVEPEDIICRVVEASSSLRGEIGEERFPQA